MVLRYLFLGLCIMQILPLFLIFGRVVINNNAAKIQTSVIYSKFFSNKNSTFCIMSDKKDISSRFIEVLNELLKRGFLPDKKAFASSVGCSTSMITEISKGRSNVGVSVLQKTVLNFGVSATWLLVGTGEMFSSEEKQKGKTAYYSPAVSGLHENVTEYTNPENNTLLSERVSHLKKENEMLTQIIEEKERLINVLLNQTK